MTDEHPTSDTARNRANRVYKQMRIAMAEAPPEESREAGVDVLEGAFLAEDKRREELEAERDEARAERDRLHDALEAVDGCLPWHEPSHPNYKGEKSDAGRAVKEALREVERGDTLDKIRREALKEAADTLDMQADVLSDPVTKRAKRKAAETVRALAEGDDQEDDEDA